MTATPCRRATPRSISTRRPCRATAGTATRPTPSESDDPSESIPPATLAALEEQGADGRAAALLAAAGDRENGTGGGSGSGGSDGLDAGEASTNAPLGDTPAVLDGDDGGFFDSVVDALSGDGGLGWVLPLTLFVILGLAIVSVIRSRRSA